MSGIPARSVEGRLQRAIQHERPHQRPADVICTCCHTQGAPAQGGVRLFAVPCNHLWCSDCLTRVFDQALESKPFKPARCCVDIHPDILKAGGDPTAVAGHMDAYLVRLEELHCRNKLYCHDPTCSAFIPEVKRSHRVGTCPSCHAKTCKKCKAKSHWGPCSEENLGRGVEGDEQLLALAEDKKWKQCPQCSATVEKGHGCPHMVCALCRCDFCYKCGKLYDQGHDCEEDGWGENLDD
ncbi:hypothetical protein GE09DRAFT_1227123 [Coniochaeta sp. 2T2.1]|nr:hypothetical protein GE09DRAFT_1227123 [Coniochaeta sp. 2T2.1]